MTRHQVVLATNNAHKLVEMRRILAEHPRVRSGEVDIEVLGLAEVQKYPEPAETEWTFEGNALIKAHACTAVTGLPALADDSGLAIDVLNGMPGVRSARWSGPEATDDSNNELLLRQLSDVPKDKRRAAFVSAIALVLPGGEEYVRRGEMSGRVLGELRGNNGFGYDPMFVPDDQCVPDDQSGSGGSEQTTGEMRSEQKDAISHRGKAIRAIVEVMVELFGSEQETVVKKS